MRHCPAPLSDAGGHPAPNAPRNLVQAVRGRIGRRQRCFRVLLMARRTRTFSNSFEHAKATRVLAAPSPARRHDGRGVRPEPGVAGDDCSGLDLPGALERLGGNAALLADLQRRFAAEHADSAREIEAFVAAHCPAHAVAALHRVKGAARIVGALALAEAAESAEDAIAHGRPPSLDTFRAELRCALAQIKNATFDRAPS
jgi:HPt (histidine-containing phosphotransfer) domain-containing protein